MTRLILAFVISLSFSPFLFLFHSSFLFLTHAHSLAHACNFTCFELCTMLEIIHPPGDSVNSNFMRREVKRWEQKSKTHTWRLKNGEFLEADTEMRSISTKTEKTKTDAFYTHVNLIIAMDISSSLLSPEMSVNIAQLFSLYIFNTSKVNSKSIAFIFEIWKLLTFWSAEIIHMNIL